MIRVFLILARLVLLMPIISLANRIACERNIFLTLTLKLNRFHSCEVTYMSQEIEISVQKTQQSKSNRTFGKEYSCGGSVVGEIF